MAGGGIIQAADRASDPPGVVRCGGSVVVGGVRVPVVGLPLIRPPGITGSTQSQQQASKRQVHLAGFKPNCSIRI